MRNDAVNVNVNEGLLAIFAEEEVAVGGVVHEEIFHKDCLYTATTLITGGINGVDQEGAKGAYKIVAVTGVTVTPTTTEDVLHGGVKYFVSGKSVTVTLSGGSSYSAVDGASNPVSLTDNGDGSYTVTMPAADVTISAN